jgi:DNA-binding IclR family transcriptional regulator
MRPGAQPVKTPPPYAIASVDHALRLATILQLEGTLTVADAAQRLGVARSTAHRLLRMLVYRDFATQDDARVYHAGPVLQLAAHSRSQTSLLRASAMPHLRRLVDALGESVNLTREGMVFAAHRTSGGLLLLAELSAPELEALYAEPHDEAFDVPDLAKLRTESARIRRQGFALNHGRSERGVVAVGVPVHGPDGSAIAGLSVSMPSVRYAKERLPSLVAALHRAAGPIEADLAQL